MELTVVLIAALALAFGLAMALVAHAGSVTRQFKELHVTLRAQQDHILRLSDAEFVRQHLRMQGVGAYLRDGVVHQVLLKDLDDVMQSLGCDVETARKYIVRSIVGLEPTVRDDQNG